MSQRLEVIVLAAGQGTRMRSDLPKVLHPLAGRPLLAHVLETADRLDPARIHVVYGHGGQRVRESFADAGLHWVEQAEQRGTGHAVMQALPAVADESSVLILYGDVPLVQADTLRPLVECAAAGGLAVMTALLDEPSGYGRIIRDAAGQIARIVEQRDADEAERAVREVNSGLMAMPAARLKQWLSRIQTDNAQGEYYLTDVVGFARDDGCEAMAVVARDGDEILGVNDRVQLARLERLWQRRAAERLMRNGTSLADPARFDLRGVLEAGRDVTIDVNVVIEGEVTLGDRVRVGANCILRDVRVGAGTVIEPMSVIEEASIADGCQIGPFARIRPGTRLHDKAKVGNFVEIKKSEIGAGSKVNHLSYIGDTTMGSAVNIGAGTITCNYDGANKHRTVIGDDAFIGSDTQLVAPVEVGRGATVGAGSTITRDAPADTLSLSRSKQMAIKGWKRPTKRPKD